VSILIGLGLFIVNILVKVLIINTLVPINPAKWKESRLWFAWIFQPVSDEVIRYVALIISTTCGIIFTWLNVTLEQVAYILFRQRLGKVELLLTIGVGLIQWVCLALMIYFGNLVGFIFAVGFRILWCSVVYDVCLSENTDKEA